MHFEPTYGHQLQGYKVGRVDQSETALGAEMRNKSKGKASEDKAKDKIVRRYVILAEAFSLIYPRAGS